jgi:hypothetical protein
MSITHDRKFAGIWIPAEIWLENSLNALEKILLVEINSLDNENGCTAGNDYFSNFLGVTSIRVSQMIKKLKDEGYIYEASFDGRVRTLKSNIKTIVRQSKDDYKAGLKEIIKQNEENYKAGLKEIINNNNTYNNQFNNKEKTNKKEIPVSANFTNTQPTVKESLTVESVEVEVVKINGVDLFEAFWKAYPKKKAKEKARQVFQKLLSKAKNKEILAEQIMKGLELYNQDIIQKQTKEEFIAHATSWLNQARWEDEYTTITPQQKSNQSTFNNQYAKPKISTTSQVAEMFKMQGEYIKNNKKTNNEEYECPF